MDDIIYFTEALKHLLPCLRWLLARNELVVGHGYQRYKLSDFRVSKLIVEWFLRSRRCQRGCWSPLCCLSWGLLWELRSLSLHFTGFSWHEFCFTLSVSFDPDRVLLEPLLRQLWFGPLLLLYGDAGVGIEDYHLLVHGGLHDQTLIDRAFN